MRKRIGLVVVLGALLALLGQASANAADLSLSPGTYTVDTTALTLTGPGTSVNGSDQGGVAVFAFDGISIPIGTTINATGTRPFKLVAAGDLALGGTIDGSGVNASNFTVGAKAGGPGGGAGGANGTTPGSGAGGGGVPSNVSSGAGGGGFGGAGATGGASGGNPGLGGSAYGDLNSLLQGGSGGGGVAGAGGGGGGGAIALVGASVRIVASGKVFVNGGGGAVGNEGASAGGSGGGLLVYSSTTLQMDGLLSAVGGAGGLGGCCGGGGGGGGGRIALQYKTLSVTGAIDVSGGTSNSRDTTSCGCGVGILGQPAGFAGFVSKSVVPDPPPTGTTPVKAGSLVLPPPPLHCVVPKLAGKKVPAAKEALKKAHCSPGKIQASYSKNAKKGRVTGQTAKAGKVLAVNSKIGLKVSKGPAAATT